MLNRYTQWGTALLLALSAGACGYSQEQWDGKVRENEALRKQLSAEQAAHGKCEQDQAAAQSEIAKLRTELAQSGASLEERNRALAEYQGRAAQLDEIRKRFELLSSKLKKLTNYGLKVEVRGNRMLVQLPGDVLFASGKDSLKKEGQEILAQVAQVIGGDPDLAAREYQVVGHTDNKPLAGGAFKDNWGLSAMRARSVVSYLTTDGKLPAKNWSAAGFADRDPVASNDTDEGRTRNRRVEIVVVPDVKEMLNLNSIVGDAAPAKPAPAPAATKPAG